MPDKKDWYAIAKEAEEAEEKQSGGKPKGPGKKPVAPAARKEWYDAAGQEVPEEAPAPKASKRVKDRALDRETLDVSKDEQLIQVSAGRRDPPWAIMGGVAGLVVLLGVAYKIVTKAPPPANPADEFNLPVKNIQRDISFGFEVNPPDGFKQQVVPEPEWLSGTHGEYSTRVYFKKAGSNVEAFYFGELRRGTTLEDYVKVGTDLPEKAAAQPIETIPEGMNGFPTKGYLLDFQGKKGLYYASKDGDIYVSVYALTSKANFDKASEDVQAAVRALKVVKPSGPRPDKQIASPPP